MNTTLRQREYIKSLEKWDESHEKYYGLDCDGYERILELSKIDQIDVVNPNINHSQQNFSSIMNERKIIRKKLTKKISFDDRKDDDSILKVFPKNEEKENKNHSAPPRIFMKKKYVLKNSGFLLRRESVIKISEKEKNKFKINPFIPMLVKTFRKFKKTKKN